MGSTGSDNPLREGGREGGEGGGGEGGREGGREGGGERIVKTSKKILLLQGSPE